MQLDERIAAAEELLRTRGVRDPVVVPEGAYDDIAAVRVQLSDYDKVAAASTDLKRLGFRYIAVDLEISADAA